MRFPGFSPVEFRQIQQHLFSLEKYRSEHEEQLIAKYSQHGTSKSSRGTNNTGIKALAFKIFSKLHKVNVAYIGKIQVYFPRLYELIFAEQLQLNNAMREAGVTLLSTPGLTLGKIFALMARYARTRLTKELNKLSSYATSYNSTLSQERNKNNKNEKFYTDKHLVGSESFAYIAMLQKKFFLRQKPVYRTLLVNGKSANFAAVHRKSIICPPSYSDDIMNIEKKKADGSTTTLTSTTTNTTTTATMTNGTSGPTNAYMKEHESIFEVILSNYDKHMKEWKHNNK